MTVVQHSSELDIRMDLAAADVMFCGYLASTCLKGIR